MFKSPLDKLLKFFQRSRDNWKSKCQLAKHDNKLLTNQTRAVEKSRDRWKQVAKAAQQQVDVLKQELSELKNARRSANG